MFDLLFRLSRTVPGFSKLLKLFYGCDIPRPTRISKETKFGHHALGVVIHPKTIIEENVFIQHHVTTGVRKAGDGLPVIKKGASIGAYAIILGPVTFGENAVIGAGSLVTHDVPANVIFTNRRENTFKEKN